MNRQSLCESFDPGATRRLLAAKRRPPGSREVNGRPTGLPAFVDRFRVLRQLGHGTYGKVYLATDGQMAEPVAVKVFHRKAAAGDAVTEEFLAEAIIATKLNHPNIVPAYDVGRTPSGECYIVSKFIDGVSLDLLLNGTSLSIEESVRIVALAADALDHAHRQDVIHRDIKPANILLGLDMTPYLADFGVATEGRHAAHAGQQIAGTPLYMSPEQLECASYLLDGRSDIFSLGVLLYRMLTGAPPFAASSLNDLKRVVVETTPAPPHLLNPRIPERLSRICLRALAKTPSDRFQTAEQFAEALGQWLEQPHSGLRGQDSVVAVSAQFLVKCPRCHVMIPKGDPCGRCRWSEDEALANNMHQTLALAFAKRRKVHVRNQAIALCLSLLIALSGITAMMSFFAWLLYAFVVDDPAAMYLGYASAVAGLLASAALVARMGIRVSLNCPACEIRLDAIGIEAGRCPNCDSQLIGWGGT